MEAKNEYAEQVQLTLINYELILIYCVYDASVTGMSNS